MAGTSSPAAGVTRVDPLPVRVDAGSGAILLYVGDRKVASAWGPVVDDPDTWILWNGHSAPYRISGGRDGAAALIDDRRGEWQRRETSLWHPDHGPVDDGYCVARPPVGAGCVGCGETALCGPVSVVMSSGDGELTLHYVCDNCESYFDDGEV